MKSLIAFSISVITFVGMSTAFAAQPAKTEIRNDRVTVKKQIAQYDINPFVDSKRVARNDRISYSFPKPTARQAKVNKEKVVRNDRVQFEKAQMAS